MEEIVTILSTREWAITIWGTGFFIWMLTQENVLISLILGDNPQKYQESSVWFGSGMYIIDGKKVRLSITKLNAF